MAAEHLLAQGHLLAIYAPDERERERFLVRISPEQRERCFFPAVKEISREESVPLLLEEAGRLMGNLDVCIHGCSRKDEGSLLEDECGALGEDMVQQYMHIFWLSREMARRMIKQKKGHIIFLLFHDALHYAACPSAPVFNEGRISLMKSLAKELAPFYVNVNALVFGYYDPGLDGAAKRKMRKKLEMFALKPPLLRSAEILRALDLLVDAPMPYWTGQVIHTTPTG